MQDFKNKIIHGECVNIMSTLPENSIDLIVTSPPYAEQRKGVYDGISETDFPDWMLSVVRAGMRVLKDDGSFIINIKEHVNKGVRSLYVMETVLLLAKEFRYVDEFMWNKTNPFPTGSKKRLKDGFERCFQFTKTSDYKFFPEQVLVKSESKWANDNARRKNKGAFSTTNGSKMAMSRRIVTDLVRPSNVITFASSCINIGHPATFPMELPEFFIKLMTQEGDIVLDPFVGSGTTALAAIRLGRNFVGIDKKKEYAHLSTSRTEEEMRKRVAQ